VNGFSPAARCALFVLLLAVVACSRLPFLDAGYGNNIDAWRVAGAARHLAETGEYEVSRFPGYPLHEIVCSLFRQGGPRALNALSAVFGLAATVAFWLIARRLGCRDATLLALAFAATPVVFVNSVSSKDYIWAIAFVLWAIHAALAGRAVACGLLVGLAIGCRVTSGAMLLPIALILCGNGTGRAMAVVLLRFGATATATAALIFSPVWLRYGLEFFIFYNRHERPGLETILARGTVEVFGTLGVIGLMVAAIATASSWWRRSAAASIPPAGNRFLVPALGAWLVLYLIAFAALPDQAGYLIPLVPAILLLAARFTPRPALQFFAACLLCAPWIEFPGGKPAAGLVVADHRERLETIETVQRFVTATEAKLPGHNTVVVGAWAPIIAELIPASAKHNRYEYILLPSAFEQLTKSGERIAYASELVRDFNYRVNGVDLAAHGAVNVRQLLTGHP
jgi:hypothetical protein